MKMITKPKPRVIKEADVLSQTREYLRWAGWYVIRIQQGMGCHRGMSDLIAVKDGIVLFLEIKTERGKLSSYQENFEIELTRKNCNYRVVRNMEDIEKVVKEFDFKLNF